MAPGKRTSSAASPAAKKQRVAADPIFEACKPMLEVLKSADDGTATELLCAALPSALKAAAGSDARHAYQESILNAVSAQLSCIVASQKEGVAAFEAEASTLEADKANSTTVQDDITSRLDAATKARSDAADKFATQKGVVSEAKKAHDSAQDSSAAADGEKASMEKERDEFVAAFDSVWTPLKNSDLGGGDWRKRDKGIKEFAEKLNQCGVEPSLLVALPVALKIKAGTRPEFGEVTIAHAEGVYKAHTENLKDRVEKFGAEIVARAAKVDEAAAALKTAQDARDQLHEADGLAQTALAAVTKEDKEQKAKMKGFGPATAKLEKKLAQARKELAHLEEVFASFEALRPVAAALKKMSGEPEVAEVAEEAPAEAPAEEAAAPAAAPADD